MGYRRKWTPSKTAVREFKEKMDEIGRFCADNSISQSRNGDSYYFTLNGRNYRVSNHTIEASNSRAYAVDGTQIRNKYHDDRRDKDTIYVHASKTRIIEIFTDLKNGYILNGRGNRI